MERICNNIRKLLKIKGNKHWISANLVYKNLFLLSLVLGRCNITLMKPYYVIGIMVKSNFGALDLALAPRPKLASTEFSFNLFLFRKNNFFLIFPNFLVLYSLHYFNSFLTNSFDKHGMAFQLQDQLGFFVAYFTP